MSRWGCGLSLAMVAILMASQSVNAAGRRAQYVYSTCVSAQPTVKTENITETVLLGDGATYHLCIACPTDAEVIIDGRRTIATGKIREFNEFASWRTATSSLDPNKSNC